MSSNLKRDRLNRFFQNLYRQIEEAKRRGTMPDHSEYTYNYFDKDLAERAVEAKRNMQHG